MAGLTDLASDERTVRMMLSPFVEPNLMLRSGFVGGCGAWGEVAVMPQRKYPLGGCVSVRVWGGDGS